MVTEKRRKYMREYYLKNKDRIDNQRRERHKNNPELREHERKYLREWRRRNPDKMREYREKIDKVILTHQSAEYKKRNPEKVKAQNRARYLTLDNKCAQCGTTENLLHHHPDYSKPDYTITLCRKCHTEVHWGK